jgi:2-dehydro-3-deoxygluconokinase
MRLAQYDMLYLSGINLAILPESDRPKLIELIKKLREYGVDIAMVTIDDEQALWADENLEEVKNRLQLLAFQRW